MYAMYARGKFKLADFNSLNNVKRERKKKKKKKKKRIKKKRM